MIVFHFPILPFVIPELRTGRTEENYFSHPASIEIEHKLSHFNLQAKGKLFTEPFTTVRRFLEPFLKILF